MGKSLKLSRKTFRKAQNREINYVAKSCQHHGGCPWCEGNRTHLSRKRAEAFSLNIESLKAAIESPAFNLPDGLSFERFQEWLRDHVNIP